MNCGIDGDQYRASIYFRRNPRGPPRRVVTHIETGERRQRTEIVNVDVWAVDYRQALLARAADHAVDMRRAQAKHIGNQLLRKRKAMRKSLRKSDRRSTRMQFEDHVRER